MGKGLKRMRLYVHRRPNAMEGHEYTDDVAITYATSKKAAIKQFKVAYGLASEDNVFEIMFNGDGIAILTDY